MMTNAQAARVRACLGCGSPDAWLCRTTKGENPGRMLRLCNACVRTGDWDQFGLVDREPVADECAPDPEAAK